MITQEEFMGGALTSVLSANFTLKRGSKRLQVLYPISAPRDVTLPDARKLKTGGPHFYLVNIGPENAVVKDAAGGAVVTLAPDDTTILCLVNNSTQAGTWTKRDSTLLGYAGVVEDAFDDTTGLTGPFTGGMATPAISAASGILTFSGQGHAVAHRFAECGRVGGAFFLPGRDFVFETAITALDDSICGARGSIGIDDHTADGSGEWYITAGRAILGYYNWGATNQIYAKTNIGFLWANVAYIPSVSQPVFLRMEYDHATTTITFKYKGDAEGAWNTLAAHNVGAGYWTDFLDMFLVIDNPTAAGTGNFSVDFDYLLLRIS